MLIFYKLLRKKLKPSRAIFCFLLINILFWFAAGFLAGALFAILFLHQEAILPLAMTSGACLALAFGYVYGYITAIRNF